MHAGPREQLNQATSFLDGSAIYGSSREMALRLRELRGGLLRTQPGPDGPLMPPNEAKDECRPNRKHRCFLSGDMRANEHLGVAAVHTLLVREHNRVASELAAVNPHWADETLFQEARRIVAAQLQHITYNEYLPVLLGQVRAAHGEGAPGGIGRQARHSCTAGLPTRQALRVGATDCIHVQHVLVHSSPPT